MSHYPSLNKMLTKVQTSEGLQEPPTSACFSHKAKDN